ncbi:MAG: DUF2752 domain-containing protein, partial [Persicimonas sp.]
ITTEKRQPGHIPLGALAMLPLFAMPLGGWLVEQGHTDFGTCAMKSLLSLPCLTCGATRATLRLLHGDVLGALALQPMIIAVYFLVALWGVVSFGLFVRDKRARIKLSGVEDKIFKGSLILVPLVNWAYLVFAGV